MKTPILSLCLALLGVSAMAQSSIAPPLPIQTAAASSPDSRDAEIRELHRELASLAARLTALENIETTRAGALSTPAVDAITQPVAPAAATAPAGVETASANGPSLPSGAVSTSAAAQPAPVLTSADSPMLNLFRTTTFGFGVDGYYGYNFNQPIGGVNLLRAYDVTSNSFNLNQASFVVERVPTPQSRFGGRVDLQFGQATEFLQGNSVNEQRPQVWRNLYQAYGSYLAPLGTGLHIDFGKFASSLGNEGSYTKDQIAYSRGYMFVYLPSYHTGLRTNYDVTPKVNAGYWLVNGANDTEDLNGFKSQAFLLTLKPASTLQWAINYYFGEEARGYAPNLYPGTPSRPAQPGLPLANISPAPAGREHIFNTYATWHATPKWTVVGEADFVVNRTYVEQQPGRVALGVMETKYTLPRNWFVGGRAEYLDDRGGLFSGRTQALKEFTAVVNHDFAPGFQMKAEYRRDWSNQRFFLSDTVGALKPAQTTATVGLIYWWGTHNGSW